MARLHLECKPDEFLVKKLGYARKEIRHHNDKGRVCNQMQRFEGLIGIVDEDPGSAQPSYLKQLKHRHKKHNIQLLEHEKENNKLILLCPRLEEWLIEVCSLNDTDITAFGLSNEGNALHREINGKLENFDKLLNHLFEKKAPQLIYLKKLLQH